MTALPVTPVGSILSRLLALHPRRIDLSLDRMWRILAALDHPQKRLPPVIHVAGTNGKGSTVAFMRAMLEAAGHSVHVYTSPNLVRVNERFRLGSQDGGVLVSDRELVEALEYCERRNGATPITVFEIETAAAFLLFAQRPADFALIEVGLGGRLDATNVIDRPLASVITSVSMDHMDFLGPTIEMIAAEKAGILKPDTPAVIGRQSENALAPILARGEEVGASLHVAGQDWVAGEERGRLVYQDIGGLLDLPAPRLFGRHQFDNAGTALATLRAAGLRLPSGAIEEGLVKAEWPARMQRLANGKLGASVPEGSELWLDGAHNVDAGRIAAAALADLEERVPRPLVLIVGMLATKDIAGFLHNYVGLACRMIAVPLHVDKTASPEMLAATAREIGIPADARESLAAALGGIGRLGLEPAPRILITGSLYLVGEALALNGTLPE